MSQAALLRATLHTLRSTVPGMTSHNSAVMYDARPPASSASMLFLSIYPSEWSRGPSPDPHETTEEEFGITLAVNMRTSVIPQDRWGREAYLNQSRSLEAASRELFLSMYRNRYSLLKLANQYLQIDTGEGVEMIEPLEYQQAPMAPVPMPAEWFGGDPEGDMINIPDGRRVDRSGKRSVMELTTGAANPLEYHGLLLEMSYRGGRRFILSGFVRQWIAVNFIATTDPTPEITGTYGTESGEPNSISVEINAQTYTPAFANGAWSIPDNTVVLSEGLHDVKATAVYEGGNTVTDATTNEINIIDPDSVWGWTDGQSHIWTNGNQAAWT